MSTAGSSWIVRITRSRSCTWPPGRLCCHCLHDITRCHNPFRNSLVCGVLAALATVSAWAQIGSLERGLPTGFLNPRPGLHLGRFEFHGGADALVAYDDLVQIETNGVAQSDVTSTFSPFISVETHGPNDRSLRAEYKPGLLFFAEHSEFNTVNHIGRVNVNWPLNRLSFGLAQTVNIASSVVRDIGNRAKQTTYGTLATAEYDMSERTSLEARFTYDLFDFEEEATASQSLFGSQQFGEQIWADYHWGAKLSAGMGATFTQLDVEDGTFQTSIGPEWRVQFTPNPKLTLRTAVGVQMRRFDSDQPDTVEPVLRLSASYQPRSGTILTLDARRTEMASGLHAGQNYVDTGFTASVAQVFLRRFTAMLGGSYTMADYVATERGVAADRTDSYYSLRASVYWNMIESVNLSVFYERTVNDSSGDAFNYDHNVAGLQATWSF